MAKAEAVTEITGVKLELTMQEARAVFACLWRVSGNPDDRSPRGAIDEVRRALTKAVTGKFDPYESNWAQPEVDLMMAGSLPAKDYPRASE